MTDRLETVAAHFSQPTSENNRALRRDVVQLCSPCCNLVNLSFA